MLNETVKICEYSDATLTSYVHVDSESTVRGPRSTVIICPGGGYSSLSGRESEPIALAFMAAGFNCFILRYSVKDRARDYLPLIEAAYALKYVRENASRFNSYPDKIFTCGFSAGGHLAGWIGCSWNDPHIPAEVRGVCKPDGMILSYPVVTGGKYSHARSFVHLTGKDEPTQAELDEFSLQKLVSPDTCPAFLWHTANDNVVPAQNSLFMAEALSAANVPFELHIFPDGPHGLSLATEETATANPKTINPHAAVWFELAVRWLRRF